MINRVCVYCASSTKISKQFLESARTLGKIFAENEITTVYGGGSVGSMGALAEGVLQNGGKIIGVIPKFMMELEWGNPLITSMIVVNTMAERKLKFIENVDAVVALPGGTGTLEELAEIISLKKLGLFTKPIIILNTSGFYNALLTFFGMMANENFIRKEHLQLYNVVENPEDIISAINSTPLWSSSAIDFAAL
jgi:uncharacterized protein (TIGR00730 family)